MVVVGAGAYSMGSPKEEVGRSSDEAEPHPVMIGHPFAVGKFHVTVAEFAAFVSETHYETGFTCKTTRAPGPMVA
jgi:formylglycine-generating enzyme required for sulfatase activity